MSTKTNKIKYGLKNVHVGSVSIADDGTVTFGTPKAYPGAVHLTLNPEGEATPFYADNVEYYVANTNNGYSGNLEMAYLYDWFEQEYLGAKLSKEGMIVEVADAEPSPFYMMYQFEGDVNAVKHIFYNVLASRASVDDETKTNNKAPKTTSIPIKAMPINSEFGYLVKSRVPSTASNYATLFTTAPSVPNSNTTGE